MELEGVVHNGVIVPDDAMALPEGTRVRISPAPQEKPRPFGERFAQFKGAVSGLPADRAQQHEHDRLGISKCHALATPCSTDRLMHNRLVLIWLALLTAVCGCAKEGGAPVARDNTSIQVGGLYATQDKSGSWRVTKVLAVDEFAVHLRSYANTFPEQPKDVDPAKLSLGGSNDPAGFGIGHFPLAKEGFFKDNPVFIKVVPVKEEELEGYKIYLEAMKDSR